MLHSELRFSTLAGGERPSAASTRPGCCTPQSYHIIYPFFLVVSSHTGWSLFTYELILCLMSSNLPWFPWTHSPLFNVGSAWYPLCAVASVPSADSKLRDHRAHLSALSDISALLLPHSQCFKNHCLYPVITYMGKECEKESIYVSV